MSASLALPTFAPEGHPLLARLQRPQLIALGISLALHAILLVSHADRHSSASQPASAKRINSTLRPAAAPQPIAPPAIQPEKPIETPAKPAEPAPRPVVQPEPVAQEDAPAASPEPEPPESAPPTVAEQPLPPAVRLAGLREYHMALGRMAAQFRRYPPELRAAGIGGRIAIRLHVGENGMPAALTLLGSSETWLLDQTAMEILRLAASHTPVPEVLRGRAFDIDLVLTFNPNDPL